MQRPRGLICVFPQSRIFTLQSEALGFDEHQSSTERFNLRSHLILSLLDVGQLLLLIDALARLSIALEDRFCRCCSNNGQLVLKTSRFLSSAFGFLFAL